MTRIEKDTLGQLDIHDDALYGIHTQRAVNNFPKSRLGNYLYFYKALSQVKLGAALANLELGFLAKDIGQALVSALQEMVSGQWFDSFIVDPLQGGAGTSTNMNINEIAANRATELLGGQMGEYLVDPLLHVNLHQSTNDVYPTALKIAALYFLNDLENAANHLLQSFQKKEQEFDHIIKLGRTELMPAVPYTLGREFSAFADAIGRDRWRIFKCTERIRQINMGGTAIGTGLTAPRKYIFLVSEKLKEITGQPLARAENLVDATQNHDQIAEVFAMIKVFAINLEKISGDIRLLTALNEIILPRVQAGSSIMPGKYNPVIPEMVSTAAKKVIGNELTATLAISHGELELNAFLPLVAYTLFESCDILTQAVSLFNEKCVIGIEAHGNNCLKNLLVSPTSTTILLPEIGYKKASEVAEYMINNSVDLIEAVNILEPVSNERLQELLIAERINALGHE
ncbi:MAG: aspartate ammonia-lyase [Candidatus Margulisiibacteriota bacterium]